MGTSRGEVSRCGWRRGATGDEARASRTRRRGDRRDRTRHASMTRLGARYDAASARGRAGRTCRRDVSEETMPRRRARAHHGRGSRLTSRRARSTVNARTPRVGQCARSRFAFAEEATRYSVCAAVAARARVPPSHPQTAHGRASRAIGPPTVRAFPGSHFSAGRVCRDRGGGEKTRRCVYER